jgi:hypothetical protein
MLRFFTEKKRFASCSQTMKNCSPQCPWCAKEFWRWMKSRMAQMNMTRPGETTSFAQAAATSVKAP